MANFLAPIINGQQFDANGDPLNSGEIFVYLAGSSTPATTYTTQAGGTPNTFPIDLNTLGVNEDGEIWLIGGSSYKFVIKDSAGVTLRTLDNMSGINDTAITSDQWVVFLGTPTYVSATSFTVPGDQTQTFTFGTRIKSTNTGGTIYSTVIRSAFSTSTTVTVINDSGSLDSGLSVVSTGVITATNASLPGTLTTPPFRNRIINGAFRFDKRNEGVALAIVAAASPAFTVDRFYASCTGANVTAQRVTGTGYQYAVTITGAASNTATLFGQRLESRNCYDWISRQVNVQVPISAVGITTVTWNAYVADVSDVFSAKTLLATGSLTLSATVETKYFSFAAGANAARGIAIEFVTGALVAGQSITYQGAIQAEAGQVSSFESVDYGEEQRRCMRYFESSYPVGVAIAASSLGSSTRAIALDTTNLVPFMAFIVEKRTNSPSVATYQSLTGAAANVRRASDSSSVAISGPTNITGKGFYAYGGTFVADAIYDFNWTASAEL